MGEYGKITSRAYAFTIQNDEILISTAETVYITDLSGNVINSYKDTDTSLFNELKSNKDSFSLNGSTYKMQKNFGRSRIVKDDGKVIYQMPLLDYIVKIGIFNVVAGGTCNIFGYQFSQKSRT